MDDYLLDRYVNPKHPPWYKITKEDFSMKKLIWVLLVVMGCGYYDEDRHYNEPHDPLDYGYPYVVVTNEDWGYDDYGRLEAWGYVQNQGNDTALNVMVVAYMYNAEGEMIGAEHCLTQPLYIRSWHAGSFDIFVDNPPWDIDHVECEVYWN